MAVSQSVSTYYRHTIGGREYFRGVFVGGQPCLCPYYYVWVIKSDGMVQLLFFVLDAAEVYIEES